MDSNQHCNLRAFHRRKANEGTDMDVGYHPAIFVHLGSSRFSANGISGNRGIFSAAFIHYILQKHPHGSAGILTNR